MNAFLRHTVLVWSLSVLPVQSLDEQPTKSATHHVPSLPARIVGGRIAPIGAYPFMTAILSGQSAPADYNPPDAADDQFCGGSLIAPNWVLTAAHCIDDIKLVLIGAHNLKNWATENYETGNYTWTPELREVITIISHPVYTSSGGHHDIMLLELNESSTLTPVDLATSAPAVGTDCTVMGWGNTEEQFDDGTGYVGVDGRWTFYPNSLREVNVPIVSDTTCQTLFNLGNVEAEICAGLVAGGQDSCQGDSGGPIVKPSSTAASGYEQLGVVSWGYGCADAGFYGVYADVSVLFQWIRDELSGTVAPTTSPAPTATLSPTTSPTATPAPSANPTPCTQGSTANETDTEGNDCDAYAGNEDWCGEYDDQDFSSNSMCCACGGGWCVDRDDGATDPYGDGCDLYALNPEWCDGYDDSDFSSNEMCCACGGGDSTINVPTSAPTRNCEDTEGGAEGTNGNNCVWYETEGNKKKCGNKDDSDFSANDMCCACGGGAIPPTPAPTPLTFPPTTTFQPTPTPTTMPTFSPTVHPIPAPTLRPTRRPTVAPGNPTMIPSPAPTRVPIVLMTATMSGLSGCYAFYDDSRSYQLTLATIIHNASFSEASCTSSGSGDNLMLSISTEVTVPLSVSLTESSDNVLDHVTTVVNSAISDGTFTSTLVALASSRRLSADVAAPRRRLGMESATIEDVVIATFSPTPAPSHQPTTSPPTTSPQPTPTPSQIPVSAPTSAPTKNGDGVYERDLTEPILIISGLLFIILCMCLCVGAIIILYKDVLTGQKEQTAPAPPDTTPAGRTLVPSTAFDPAVSI